ncbi:MAG: 4Fe-4S binding protein [Clostridia bacterium]|nr:4Fe-4S binding protein [Clostridia bacterium]
MNRVTFQVDLCKGCGLCTQVCPKKILILSPDTLNAKGYHPAEVTDMDKCIACAMCATMCPDTVIRVERDV